MDRTRVAVLAGCRTPFARAGTDFAGLSAIALGRHAVRETLARANVPPEDVDHLVFGTVVHDPRAPNMAREVGLATLPASVPAVTVSLACASSNRAVADAANLIESGRADLVVAGGAESLSRIPILVSDRLSGALVKASRARSLGARLRAFGRVRPRDLIPVPPAIAEPSTGETMGQAAERMAKENGISREDQDRWAFESHRKAHAGTEDGRLAAEIAPVYVPPKYDTTAVRDNGVRPDTSVEALSGLRPVFDRKFGSVTAGNSSPLTDGASAVLMSSEERARNLGIEPLGYVRSFAFAALDPGKQLLQGPAYAAPVALDRAGIAMADVDVMEMHEAFSAQVLSNLRAWDSDDFCRNELDLPSRLGHPDPEKINVMGGSIAVGHPFAATGGRLTITLLNEMRRRDGQFGLITVCAAGGLGFAMVLERG